MSEPNLKFPLVFPPGSKILVAPLEWGLGHATRCIPIISNLIIQFDARVTVAANGIQQAIIQEYFPKISFVTPPSFTIKYGKKRADTLFKLVAAIPRFIKVIKKEHQWLEEIVQSQKFDYVISDNRYGLHHRSLPCYIITHQLEPKTPLGKPVDRFIQGRLYRYINRFTGCWVPDYAEVPGLGGELSHPKKMPSVPLHYLGPLSRIRQVEPTGKVRLLILLSGPEPQRTILENSILKELSKNQSNSAVIVRGLPTGSPIPNVLNGITLFNHLPADELSQLIANAEFILCRSGYSSMMDLIPLKKNLFVVPTPGQTEQEYLARHLSKLGLVTPVEQDNLNLLSISSQHG